ncbi:MAG: hypothetical protein AB8G96_16160 [Phycisphaerales bacterium]
MNHRQAFVAGACMSAVFVLMAEVGLLGFGSVATPAAASASDLKRPVSRIANWRWATSDERAALEMQSAGQRGTRWFFTREGPLDVDRAGEVDEKPIVGDELRDALSGSGVPDDTFLYARDGIASSIWSMPENGLVPDSVTFWDGAKVFTLDPERGMGRSDEVSRIHISIRPMIEGHLGAQQLPMLSGFLLADDYLRSSWIPVSHSSLIELFDSLEPRVVDRDDEVLVRATHRVDGGLGQFERVYELAFARSSAGIRLSTMSLLISQRSAEHGRRSVREYFLAYDRPSGAVDDATKPAAAMGYLSRFAPDGRIASRRYVRYSSSEHPLGGSLDRSLESIQSILKVVNESVGNVPVLVRDETMRIAYEIGKSEVFVDDHRRALDEPIGHILRPRDWVALVKRQDWGASDAP